MKIIFLTKCKMLAVMAIISIVISASSYAQQYDYKYVGKYEADKPDVPYNGGDWDEVDYSITDWQTCEELHPTWWWRAFYGTYGNGGGVVRCYTTHEGDHSSWWHQQMNGTGTSRYYYLYKSSEIGNTQYAMEVTGVAIYTSGMNTGPSDATEANPVTQFQHGGIAWRQVPKELIAPKWDNVWTEELPQNITFDNSQLEDWLALDVTPKFQTLVAKNKPWDIHSIPYMGSGGATNIHIQEGHVWLDLPVEKPFVLNPDSNLEMAFMQDHINYEMSAYQYEDLDGDICTAYRSGGFDMNQTLNYWNPGSPGSVFFPPTPAYLQTWNSTLKPHLRLRYRYLSCEDVNAWMPAPAYKSSEPITPENFNISFDMSYAPVGSSHHITYTIIGPYPYTDTVYRTAPIAISDADKDENNFHQSTLADYADIIAEGAVATDGISFDGSNSEPGTYTLIANVQTQLEGFTPNEARYEFILSAGLDLVAREIREPIPLQQYCNERDNPINIVARVSHNGLPEESAISEFYMTATLYAGTYNSSTGNFTRSRAVQTLPTSGAYHWTADVDNGGVALQPGDVVEVFPAQFGGGFNPNSPAIANAGRYFEVEFKVWLPDENADWYLSNNTFPRDGRHLVIQVQKEYEVTINPYHTLPATGARAYLGQTMYVQTGIENKGLIDLSEKAGYELKTTIYRSLTGGANGAPVWAPAPYIIRHGSDGEGIVTIQAIDDETLAPIGWLVNETGAFNIETELWRDGVNTNLKARSMFTVTGGLTGTVRISQNGGDYPTIKAAVDALYLRGVDGNVVFELHDAEYNESSWTDQHPEFPALDFRGKIPGVCDTINGVSRIRTITFKPGGALAGQRASIHVNLESKAGYGMMFGNANDAVAHPYSLFNNGATYDKQVWYKSDGYITWDGGANKSIVLSLAAPAGGVVASDPINYFRAPIYLSNAKNITIANCIIEENEEALARSNYFLLPGNSYNGPLLGWNDDYSVASGQGYSAGIVLRSVPPYQTEYQENYYNLTPYPCVDNTISGNEISSFSYGVASIGLDFRNDVPEFVINIVDTVYNITLQDLGNARTYFNCNRQEVYAGVPAGGSTTVTWYREQVPTITRGMRYYKHHQVQHAGGVTSEFVQILDSATNGIARVFNRNTVIEDNLIYDISRAGIFLGNDENSIIRGNTITGITGVLTASDGTVATEIDVAGIMLGGNQRTHEQESSFTHGSMVVGTEIYRNEISKLAGSGAIHGIKLEQVQISEGISSDNVKFPDRPERLKIYNNIIWDFRPATTSASRYGINLSLGKKVANALDNPTEADAMYYATADANYFLDDILIANNTIVLGDDGSDASAGDYFGLRLQRIKNARVLNNAIELEDETLHYASTNASTFAAMIYYQGPKPSELNNTIDYNAFGYAPDGVVDAYCHVLTDSYGNMIDIAHRGEYQTLTNWQNWIGTDLYSVARSFSSDLEATVENYPRLRFRTSPALQGSVLDKRGTYVAEAEADIDGVARTTTDVGLDIGAQYINSAKLARDIEVLTITAPATYKASVGPWSDAEYFMLEDAAITVKALVRNNGSTALLNEKVVLNVYQESGTTNNAVATILGTAHNTTYYNNERGLFSAKYSFPAITPAGVPFFTSTKEISLRVGESIEVEFRLDKSFNTYYFIGGTHTTPAPFTAMRPNVTPRYLFQVSTDIAGDMDITNDAVSKSARFYIKKSRNDMLVTAINTHYSIVPSANVSNTDWIAGRLNLDTLQQGFTRLNLHQLDAESNQFDYDVIDRHTWDYRNIDYTLYKTLYITDELEKDQSRWISNRYDNTLRLFREQWYAQDLLDFLTSSNATSKKNLVIASENFISDIHKSLLQTSQLNILSGRLQRDTFLYNDSRRLAFLNTGLQVANLRDSLNKILVRDHFRADVVYDSLADNGPYTWNENTYSYEYLPVSPLYTKAFVAGNEIEVSKWRFVPSTYKFEGKSGSITGNTLNASHVFEIRPTGWFWSGATYVEDAPPYGTIFRPIDNILGVSTVGAVYDTVSKNPGLSQNPQAGKVAALCISTVENNIALLGFDWRHFANVEDLLGSIREWISKNGGDGTDDGGGLPISFYGFDANAISNRVELEWNTASGSVISRFDVERADVINNKIGNFKHLETVPAQPNVADNMYNATDRNLKFGSTLAYRLKMTDANGNSVYTNNKIVNIEQAQFVIGDITPNPVTAISEFTITNNAEQNLYIAVYDMSGKEMFVLNSGMLPSGNYKFEIDGKSLSQATYTLTIRSAQQTLNKQFTVVK